MHNLTNTLVLSVPGSSAVSTALWRSPSLRWPTRNGCTLSWNGRTGVPRATRWGGSSRGWTRPARFEEGLRTFYTRLCRRGKPWKVALVAAMRKLLLILNAEVWSQVPWQSNRVPTAGEA